MADYAFDTCFPFPLTTTIERATVGSDRAQGFAAKRAVYERGRRLVGDDHFGMVNERKGNHNPLAQATGQLMWVPFEPLTR